MDPAGVCKKGVPEWLNSSLWSSPRSPLSAGQRSSTVTLPSDQLKKGASFSENLPATPEIGVSTASSEEPNVSDASEVKVPDAKISEVIQKKANPGCENEDGKPIRLACSENGVVPPISRKISDDECEFNDPLKETQINAKEAAHTESSGMLSLIDEEISDLFNREGPSPSSLWSASSITTMFMSPSVARSSSFDSRVSQFNCELSKKVISMVELQRLASQGIPDSGSIRSVTWKLLLGYLPKNRDFWSLELDKKRAEYAAFKVELLVTPSEVTRRKEDNGLDISQRECQGPLPRHDITQDDHPLSLGKTSIWHQFFLDSEVCEQIDRDVKRTHPGMHFFCGDSAASLDHQEAMKRVLFIFSKLNPGIRYVQGMNEVLAPLYYVFKTDTDEATAANAEADSFFCFVSLLGDFRDHFVQQLDNSAVGIRSTIGRLNELLKWHDEELWRHLEHISKVNPQFYAFRWITLLLTQEFTFPDSLRLWDSLLGNPEGPLEILLRVCCAMLMSVRSRLLAGDFTSNLKLLQRYPSIDVHHLIRVADELKTKTHSFG